MDQNLIAPCGLDCEKCEARIATLHKDEVLKKAVAKRWSELNHVDITPEMICCLGCQQTGPKTLYCESLCPIRPCVKAKGYRSCGTCAKSQDCPLLAPILGSAPEAGDNLKKARKK